MKKGLVFKQQLYDIATLLQRASLTNSRRLPCLYKLFGDGPVALLAAGMSVLPIRAVPRQRVIEKTNQLSWGFYTRFNQQRASNKVPLFLKKLYSVLNFLF